MRGAGPAAPPRIWARRPWGAAGALPRRRGGGGGGDGGRNGGWVTGRAGCVGAERRRPGRCYGIKYRMLLSDYGKSAEGQVFLRPCSGRCYGVRYRMMLGGRAGVPKVRCSGWGRATPLQFPGQFLDRCLALCHDAAPLALPSPRDVLAALASACVAGIVWLPVMHAWYVTLH